jgi:hypothetical protein
VAKLVAAAQHHASLTPYLTTEGATLQIVKHQWHGVKAINTWFKGQYRQNLKVSLLTLVSVQGGTARAMIRWITGTGKTLQVTQQQAVWRFSGARIQKITLDPVKVPVPAGPPSSVPTPPSGSPPHVTPTIPS